MTAPTFTPGPWRRAGHRSIAAGTGLASVTLAEVFSGGVDLNQADANEALIAAAPELFAAAEAAAAVLAKGKLVLSGDAPEAVALRKLLRALCLAREVFPAPEGPAS